MTDPIRVLVIEDDADVAMFVTTVLQKKQRCIVRALDDPQAVPDAVEHFAPDLVITDIELPGMSGLELITGIRAQRPGIPVIVMTAHASIDHAVTALRNQADEFLTKPVPSAELLGHVERLAEVGRQRIAAQGVPETVLAIGAHPDDVEVGVGGILAAHAAAGDRVIILTLSKGELDGGIREAWVQCSAAAEVIGAQLQLEDLPQPLGRGGPVDETIARAVARFAPTIVYAPSRNDDDPDHRAVHHASLVASSAVRTVACYQAGSATVDFRPTRFVDIDGHTDAKLEMLSRFQRSPRPDYLAPDFALATARAWSRFGTGRHCEPLELVRDSASLG